MLRDHKMLHYASKVMFRCNKINNNNDKNNNHNFENDNDNPNNNNNNNIHSQLSQK